MNVKYTSNAEIRSIKCVAIEYLSKMYVRNTNLTVVYIYTPKTKKFGCVGRGDLTFLFFSKIVK